MRIILVGDVHGNSAAVARILAEAALVGPPDLMMITGDVGPDLPPATPQKDEIDAGYFRQIAGFADAFGVPIIFVPGNHDRPEQNDDWRLLHNVDLIGRRGATPMEIRGLTLAGMGGNPTSPFGWPYEWDADEVRERLLSEGRRDADIVLSHAPPHIPPWSKECSPGLTNPLLSELDTFFGGVSFVVSGHVHEEVGCKVAEGVGIIGCGAVSVPDTPFERFFALDWDPPADRATLLTLIRTRPTARATIVDVAQFQGLGGPDASIRTLR